LFFFTLIPHPLDENTMRHRIRQLGGFLCLLLASGCTGLFGSRGLPSDPLFAHRKPVESKALAGPPQDVPLSEPRPPVNPYVPDPGLTSAR
jgi:hypothetical protein